MLCHLFEIYFNFSYFPPFWTNLISCFSMEDKLMCLDYLIIYYINLIKEKHYFLYYMVSKLKKHTKDFLLFNICFVCFVWKKIWKLFQYKISSFSQMLRWNLVERIFIEFSCIFAFYKKKFLCPPNFKLKNFSFVQTFFTGSAKN